VVEVFDGLVSHEPVLVLEDRVILVEHVAVLFFFKLVITVQENLSV
jgi:hypothetical protein